VELKRRLYSRGSSYETTIPKPLLFSIDSGTPHDVLFIYDREQGRWYIEIQEREGAKRGTRRRRGEQA